MNDQLPSGGTIRKVFPGEFPLYLDHLLRLDDDSRRNRFGGAVSESFIRSYVEISVNLDTIIYGFFLDGILRGAAELRPLGPAFRGEAEAAFSIEKEWQSHGVGSALLSRILLAARNRGLSTLYMSCLAGNQRMQSLARKFDAELKFDFGTIIGEVESPNPTPMSLMREFIIDSAGFATAIMDVQTRYLKPSERA